MNALRSCLRLASAAAAALGLVSVGLTACSDAEGQDGAAGRDGAPAAAGARAEPGSPTPAEAPPGELTPVPLPVPLAFPLPIEVPSFDQREAFSDSKLNLARVDHYSILARDEVTGDLGIATVSNVPAIGALAPAARAGAGVVLVGAAGNTAWKNEALDALAAGKSAEEVVAQLARAESENQTRQLAVLDRDGRSACYIGQDVPGGPYQTYFLARPGCMAVACQIPKAAPKLVAMLDAFEASGGFPLPERLMLALQAAWNTTPGGIKADAHAQFRQQPKAHPAVSAAMLVVRESSGYDHRSDVLLDLRVDLSRDPLPRLTESYYGWGWAVMGHRLIAALQRIDPQKDPAAYELTQRWVQRVRRRAKIGEE